MTWHSRCLSCQRGFMATDAYVDLCPTCQADEDAQYRVQAADVVEPEMPPFKWSRAAMRERLGVSGDVDE